MAEAGKPESSANTKQGQQMGPAGSDETLLQDALILQHELDSNMKSKGRNAPPNIKYPDPAENGDEDEITARCHAVQAEQEKQKAANNAK